MLFAKKYIENYVDKVDFLSTIYRAFQNKSDSEYVEL